ncbi:MAG: hypothetical protein IJ211_01460 [Campylobacter sp.]|nr:hypothetical protein [Campylobacter sp.]
MTTETIIFWFIKMIFVLLPVSILVDFANGELKFRNDIEQILAMIVSVACFVCPICYEFFGYLKSKNFDISLFWFIIMLALHIFGTLVMIGLAYFLYEKIFKYPTRFVRGVLYEIFYSLKGFIFMQNCDEITKTAKEDWVNFLIENKVSEETFAKITPFASHNEFMNWAQQQGGESEALGVKIMKKQWEK